MCRMCIIIYVRIYLYGDVFTFDWMDLEKYLVSGDLHEMQNIFVRIYFICDCNDVEVVLLRYRVLVINGWYYL
jgi:hypothetical protein